MMARTNFIAPPYINAARNLAMTSEDDNVLARRLAQMTDRHEALLRELHSVVDSYNQLLDTHGPFHEIELGEPVARFEKILRKALNDSQ